MTAVLLTVSVYDRLAWRVLVKTLPEADALWARWARARYAQGEPAGGATMQRTNWEITRSSDKGVTAGIDRR
ncbi:MAG: hypothetical protein VW239_07065 [Candidatus Nanopelagicales bacterium]